MKNKRNSTSKRVTAILTVAAVALIAIGSVTGARAALTYSATYRSDFATQNIGVGLVEKTGDNAQASIADDGALLTNLVGDGETFIAGKNYDEQLMAENTGDIDEYVKMTVRKYWTDADGKRVDLDPQLIQLTFNTNDWIVVDKDTSDETVVLYYRNQLTTDDPVSTPAVTNLAVDSSIANIVTQSGDTTIHTEYYYNGLMVGLDVDVDGVQTHHADDAIISAWGADLDGISVSGDTLTD